MSVFTRVFGESDEARALNRIARNGEARGMLRAAETLLTCAGEKLERTRSLGEDNAERQQLRAEADLLVQSAEQLTGEAREHFNRPPAR